MTFLTYVEAWGAVSFPLGVLAGWLLKPCPRYRKAVMDPAHPRGGRKLNFMFTLYGEPTGEMVPDGCDPVHAAAERSRVEGKMYGARRV